MTGRRFVQTVFVAVVAIGLLAGCSLGALSSTSGTAVTSGSSASSAMKQLYAQKVAWKSCGTRTQCGTVAAPSDWAKPAGAELRLAVVRVLSTGHAEGALFTNPGGPGASGYDFVKEGANYAADATLLSHYDLVGWDPRGVGRSSPVRCLSGAQTDALLYGTFSSPFQSQAWADALIPQEKAFAAACLKNTGPLLGHIDTSSVARDLDLLRAVITGKKLDYLGYSYGTEIGTRYAELFPKNIDRMVLDGAVDPKLSSFDELRIQMAGFESATRAWMSYCLGDSKCPFSGDVDTAMGQLHSALVGVTARHLVNSDGRVLDEAVLGTALSDDLYSESEWPELENMLAQVAAGRPAAAFKDADDYNGRIGAGQYQDNSFEVYTSVSCLDGTFGQDSETMLQRLHEIDVAAPTVGVAVALDDFARLDTVCPRWPVPHPQQPTDVSAKGAPPIIVIGTTNDPATPYAEAQALAADFDSGVLITRHGQGHTAYNGGNSCIDRTVDNYFDNGTVPKTDPEC